MRELRAQVLDFPSETSRSFPSLFSQNLIINVRRVLFIASSMSASSSANSKPAAGGSSTHSSEKERLRKAMESDRGTSIFPLPKGHYPLHDGYPLARKDGESTEINELLESANALIEREDIVLKLKERMSECSEDHLEWVESQKQKALSAMAEQDSRAKEEWRHIEDMLKVEKDVSESRVQAVALIDELARKELKILEEIQESKSKGVKCAEDLEIKRRACETEIAQLREISDQAELHAHGKIQGLLCRRGIVG